MRLFGLSLLVVATLLTLSSQTVGQTYDLQFVEVATTATTYDVKIQVKTSGLTFGMGDANLVFTYPTAVIDTPTILTRHNFSGGVYSTMGLTQPFSNAVSINIVYNGGGGTGTTVPGSFFDVVTVRFKIKDISSLVSLIWRRTSPNATIVFDDDFNPLSYGTLSDLLNDPLPIQLSSFTATALSSSQVRLDWTTLSETNNYGFEVQKSLNQPDNYQTITNSFIPGHGTTIQPHTYTFTDGSASPGSWWYRLKQIDMDGTVHFVDGIQVDVLTGVKERPVPTEFALDQNFPNPFNPSTFIEFALPAEAHVKLEVYNVIGERVATLVDETRQVGYYTERFDASRLASGLYFYRLSTKEKSFLKKMLLVR